MAGNIIEEGWKRFLQRLRRLWGDLRGGKLIGPSGPVFSPKNKAELS